MTGDDSEYQGPAVIVAGPTTVEVQIWLNGRFEPHDGRYHWGGRVAPNDVVVGLLRGGHRSVTIQVGGGTASAARLSDVDPWGGIRVVGTSTPPWTAHAYGDNAYEDNAYGDNAYGDSDEPH